MVFSSTIFLFLYLPIVLLIYYNGIFKSRTFRNNFLLFASLIFYAWGEPVFVFLMLFSILVTYIVGRMIARNTLHTSKKVILSIGICYHVLVLFVFKYLTWIAQEVGLLLHKDYSDISIALPIGISFFTFQMMSYLFDVYYEKVDVQKNILKLGLYISLFPQLIAGPIVRYKTIEYEISNRIETKEDFCSGVSRFVLGLGKKALIADLLGQVVDSIFVLESGNGLSMLTAWIGAIAYTLQIYFDFSGYSDMAIGLGRCFGFHFSENFNHPYVAKSITEFWKRWHISLTDWFRDYVYIPLGGNRVKVSRHIINIGIVWILTGIWHGANWTFLLWGMIYCVFQLLEKYCYSVSKWPLIIQRVYTLLIICINWVIFRSASVKDALHYISCMFGKYGGVDTVGIYYLQNSIIIILIAIVCCLPLLEWKNKLRNQAIKNTVEIVFDIGMVIVFLLCIVMFISSGYSPFIYFNF